MDVDGATRCKMSMLDSRLADRDLNYLEKLFPQVQEIYDRMIVLMNAGKHGYELEILHNMYEFHKNRYLLSQITP